MGSGKTIWMFNKMFDDKSTKYIFVTPYREQIHRMLLSTKTQGMTAEEKDVLVERYNKEDSGVYSRWYLKRGFRTPGNYGYGKLDSLHTLLIAEKNIITTHALFSTMSEETAELINNGEYTLVIDEDISLIEVNDIYNKDIHMLINDGIVKKGKENESELVWADQDYSGEFNNLKITFNAGHINKISNNDKMSVLVWRFKNSYFECFKAVWLMTYLFEYTSMCHYFSINNYTYTKYTMEDYNLVPAKQIKQGSGFKHLLNIYEGKLNRIGDYKTALSKNWLERYKDLRETQKNNLYNYFRNITKSNGGEFAWTTFRPHQEKLWGKGYKSDDCFISLNTKATNRYRHKTTMAYCCNRFMNPSLKLYYNVFDIKIDEDGFALAELVQWIWRSQVRDDKLIQIYIPSKRMRELLINWLNTK
jgi:hypothetical protein